MAWSPSPCYDLVCFTSTPQTSNMSQGLRGLSLPILHISWILKSYIFCICHPNGNAENWPPPPLPIRMMLTEIYHTPSTPFVFLYMGDIDIWIPSLPHWWCWQLTPLSATLMMLTTYPFPPPPTTLVMEVSDSWPPYFSTTMKILTAEDVLYQTSDAKSWAPSLLNWWWSQLSPLSTTLVMLTAEPPLTTLMMLTAKPPLTTLVMLTAEPPLYHTRDANSWAPSLPH